MASVLLLAGSAAFADVRRHDGSRFLCRSWFSDDGLPHDGAPAILQTRDGYVWVATRNGLARFDGTRFTLFSPANAPGLASGNTASLFEDRQGRLWIGTLDSGLALLENGVFRTYGIRDGLPSQSIMPICEDGQGRIWAGTNVGLARLVSGRFRRFPFPGELQVDGVNDLHADARGRVWVVSRNGLACIDNERLVRYQGEAELGISGLLCGLVDSRGAVWVGARSGLARFGPDGHRDLFTRHDGLPGNSVDVLFESRDGKIWAGGEQGLCWFQAGRFASLSVDLSSNSVSDIGEDREGNLWVATEFGLNMLRQRAAMSWTKAVGLPDDQVLAVHQDRAGRVWFGTEQGFCFLDRSGRLEPFPLGAHLPSKVQALAEDSAGRIWIGGPEGAGVIEGHRARPLSPLAGHDVTHIHCSRNGVVWLGTRRGLFSLANGQVRRPAMKTGLSLNRIWSMCEDSRGGLWLGLEEGLCLLRDGSVSVVPAPAQIRGHSVYQVHLDRRGVFWICSSGGLLRLEKDRWTTYPRTSGAPQGPLLSLLEDDHGFFWIGSKSGLYRVSRDGLERWAAGSLRPVSARLFTKSDGLSSSDFSVGYFGPKALKDDAGRLWFISTRGVVMIDPDNLPRNELPPPVHVEALVVDDEPLPAAGRPSLPAGTRRLEIRYTALSYTVPERVQFRVMLDGFDREWREAGTERRATYTNLKPGAYTFRVRACNNDGVWNERGAALAFTVRSYVWQRAWFIVLALLLFASSSYGVIHYVRDYMRVHTFWKKKNYIGHYKLLETIGTGGMGTVYKALDLLAENRVVALKVLKEENFASEAHKKRFRNEAAVIDQLDHPNIVQILERGQTDEHLYIAMELVEGITLARRIREQGPLPIPDALEIMTQVAGALERIHGHSIVHRDLKPENIIVAASGSQAGRVKLLDFGLAINPAHSRLTESGIVIGTLHYMPPERLSTGASAQPGDIYSLGMIFYEMLTTLKPFAGDDTLDVVKKILNDLPPPLERERSESPPALCELITRMIEKDPAYRPLIAEVRAGLEAVRARCGA